MASNAPDGPKSPGHLRRYAHDIVFRTSPYGVLSQLVNPTNAAFEIDDIDRPTERQSASVIAQVQGSCTGRRSLGTGGVVPAPRRGNR